MDFMVGCNYWASHAGTETWAKWDEATVEKDFAELKKYGVEYLRVFPNWRDFQPVKPCYGWGMTLYEYRMEDDSLPTNPYYLDETMLARFARLCALAEKYGLKLIVGIVTGWMSARQFVPSLLYGRNLYTDPVATAFTLKFVRGFVKSMKDQPSIVAWDLGNECNCLSDTSSRETAYTWTAMVSNAIKAEDGTRDVISGMHGLRPTGTWTIADQGELTDVLTTHPYPYWVAHTRKDKTISFRTLMHAQAESEMYSALGKKPVLVEEVGTMGPQVCSEENTGIFMRCQLFSAWANGQKGLLWWCAFDQNQFTTPPYAWTMIERYLGLFENGYLPKPALLEMKRFSECLKTLPKLPKKQIDAVCILSKDIDHWGVAYMTYALAKKAGLSITFVDGNDALPDAKCYLLPSVSGTDSLEKTKYDALKRKVEEGATLYVSMDNGIMTEFEEFFGAKLIDSCERATVSVVSVGGEKLTLSGRVKRFFELRSAKLLIEDEKGEPVLMENRYGLGKVYFLNMPLEANLIEDGDACEVGYYRLYDCFAKDLKKDKPFVCENVSLAVTYHEDEGGRYAVIINCTDEVQSTKIRLQSASGYETLYGDGETLLPGEACVLKLK